MGFFLCGLGMSTGAEPAGVAASPAHFHAVHLPVSRDGAAPAHLSSPGSPRDKRPAAGRPEAPSSQPPSPRKPVLLAPYVPLANTVAMERSFEPTHAATRRLSGAALGEGAPRTERPEADAAAGLAGLAAAVTVAEGLASSHCATGGMSELQRTESLASTVRRVSICNQVRTECWRRVGWH